MTTNHLSLYELTARLERYDRLPVPIAQNMQLNLKRAAVVSGMAIPFFTAGTQLIAAISQGWYSFLTPWDFVGFPAEIAFFLAALTGSLSPILLVLNALSLGVMAVLFWRSRGFTLPVEEVLHWLAGAGFVVACASAVSMAIVTIGFLANLVIALALWILGGVVIAAFCLACVSGFFLALGAR